MEPPCIADKCLKYPACKNKTDILCNDFRDYMEETYEHFRAGRNRVDGPRLDRALWRIFNRTLPNLKVLRYRKGSYLTEYVKHTYANTKGYK